MKDEKEVKHNKLEEKKEKMAKKMGRTATKEDRKKDPYLSSDSKVYKK